MVRLKPYPLSGELAGVLRELYQWSERTGEWEDPAWRRLRQLLKRLDKPAQYRCPVCGSPELEVSVRINPNMGSPTNAGPTEDYFCRDCGADSEAEYVTGQSAPGRRRRR